MNTFDGCCGSCVHLNTNDYVNHKNHCYCTYRKQYYNLTERKCSYYQYDPNKDYYDLNRRWHIVSVVLALVPEVAQIPGMDRLQNFRIDVLEKDEQYETALRIYDIIGPFLSREIALDTDRQVICSGIITNHLAPIAKMVMNEDYTEAFKQYAEMVNTLSTHYQKDLNKYMAIKLLPRNALQMKL